ncbi:EAP30/Vps36 family-domain-containing protein [Scheffersomyces xylosifermentans]|uniref:EAP30/Vps36 family-domain-containing protein n=1 Tax=Scheffersomyces xylosifermentans TaxID=1304137 RepID=UPI00315CA5EB
MSWLHVWKPILINRSSRPILRDDEDFLCTTDNVGLYQGKSKILGRQNGIIYLTNKRIIYFDGTDNANSMAIELSDISHAEFIEQFFRSSPKVKAYLKPTIGQQKNGDSTSNDSKTVKSIAWVCKICSYNNQIPSNFDLEENDLPKCGSCGIRPNRTYIEKILEEGNKNSEKDEPIPGSESMNGTESILQPTAERRDDQCPKCTFINHPSMKYCELCGTELKSVMPKSLQLKITESLSTLSVNENNSHNPMNLKLENSSEVYTNSTKPYVKLSFRKGGENEFFRILNDTLAQMKWDSLKSRGAINQNATKLTQPARKQPTALRLGGIHGLEQLGEQQRKQNEMILSSSLGDLENLMFKSQDLIKLSNSFTKFIIAKRHPRAIPTGTKLVPPLDIKKTSSLYHKELSRHISEYSTNYELTKVSSMITSQDLFANYNRYLILTQGFGSELVSPQDFNQAIDLFDQLRLPIKLKQYEKSGLVVLAPRSKTSTYEQNILICLKEQEYQFKYNKLRNEMLGMMDEFLSNEYRYFKGNTIAEISDKFGWSYNITLEEIEKCIDQGSIVIDQSVSGTFYYINKFALEEEDDRSEMDKIRKEIIEEQKSITADLKSQYELSTAEDLINLNPDYTFGIDKVGEILESDLESFRETPEPTLVNARTRKLLNYDDADYNSLNEVSGGSPSEPQSNSLNDLQGLRFE